MKKKTTLNQSFFKDEAAEAQAQLIEKWMKYLNFRSYKEYQAWCTSRKLEPHLNKSNYLLQEERELRAQELLVEEERRKAYQQNLVTKDSRIKKIFEDIQSSLKNNNHLQEPWKEILNLRHRCVFSPDPFIVGSVSDHAYFISAYFRLAQYHDLFLKSPSKIKIKKSNPEAYFQEVVSQLIGRYPLPKAFINWWFTRENKWDQAYVNLAQGKKVYEVFKEVETIPLTHRQVNLLMSKFAKHTSSYPKARLQAILASIKAPGKLESALIHENDFLEDLKNNYQFKIDYLTFLTKEADFFDWNRTIDLWHYVSDLKNINPNFSFKNRSLVNLLDAMHMWHTELGISKQALEDKRRWDKTGIGDYESINEKTKEKYTIKELTSGKEIHAEGKTMSHCVYSYVPRCEQKVTAIFSMKYFNPKEKSWKGVGTIEVNLKMGKVVQFKAKRNQTPDSGAQLHLRKWAIKENITV